METEKEQQNLKLKRILSRNNNKEKKQRNFYP